MGQMQPLSGELHFGASLNIGYFAQAHDSFDADNTVMDELLRHKFMLTGQARSYLAQYLFRGDDVFKPVRQLSGGERGRLALAILALEGANFLLLDEPTNHLDIPAQEVLQEVLEHFDGTILLVSHDRYLVDRLATQIWELRDGRSARHRGHVHELHGAAHRRTRSRQGRSRRRPPNDAPVAERGPPAAKRRAPPPARSCRNRRDHPHAGGEARRHRGSRLAAASLAQDLPEIQPPRHAHEHTGPARRRPGGMESWRSRCNEGMHSAEPHGS